MSFNSLEFAMFLLIVFAVYWILPHRFRWILLLISNYFFYMSWNPKYVVLILFTTIVSYFVAILINKQDNKKKKRCILIGALIACLGVLFIFKYFNFVFENLSRVASMFSFRMNTMTLNLLLPVGISFYTFQTLSYIIDVYKGKVEPERNFGVYATFISFFPQLAAGPIERAENLLPQINSEKKFDYNLAMYGARQMLWGFFKKIAVADVVAVYVDSAYNNLSQCTGFDLCMAIFFFTIQIYCDFSGYSDIAIGTAKLLGINLMKNFSSPYFSLSIKEFWSRWHISLSTWFRDYVYIPLGGNRRSKAKNYFNLLVTFLVSGLWHGANLTYIIWGGIHGLGQVVEKVLKLDTGEKGRVRTFFSWVTVFAFCNFAWVFFRADNFHDAIYVIYHAFSPLPDISAYLHSAIGIEIKTFIRVMLMIIIVAIYDYMSLKCDLIELIASIKMPFRVAIEYIIVILIGIALINSTGTNQFVYFQF